MVKLYTITELKNFIYFKNKNNVQEKGEKTKNSQDGVSMGDTNVIQPPSANLKRAICWVSETVTEHPQKNRAKVIREAGLLFDMTPNECEFLNKNFQKTDVCDEG